MGKRILFAVLLNSYFPTNDMHWSNVGSTCMLVHRLRRWLNIDPTLSQLVNVSCSQGYVYIRGACKQLTVELAMKSKYAYK